jgi:hypothetical protein
VAKFKLPVFNRAAAISNDKGLPSPMFHRWWQDAVTKIEGSINAIQDALAAAGIALAAADNANAAAATAQGTAKLASSGMTGLTLTASESSGTASISISTHTRVYGDGTSVTVNSGSVSSLLVSTLYAVYYNDPTFVGGSVTYLATDDPESVSQTGGTHIVGLVMTPGIGDPPNDGSGPRPPGFEFEYVP